jgi:hypothetical protein
LRHALFSLMLLAFTLSSFAQDAIPEPAQRTDAPYRLFRSQNIFLKLDTRTGELWQVQWGVGPQNRIMRSINGIKLADGKKTGRFTLYPTQNANIFILLDQEDGRQWLVQWSLEESKRFMVPFTDSTRTPGS